MRSVGSIDWAGRTALVRADLNVPVDGDGRISDDTRLSRSLPTLSHIVGQGGGCAVLSHLGRPAEGRPDPALSLRPVHGRLAAMMPGSEVGFADDLSGARKPGAGQLLLLENTRFNPGERSADPGLCARYAQLGDVFVMDAFASAHRSEASTTGVAKLFSERAAGLLLEEEVRALDRVFGNAGPPRPFVAVVGGAKVSTKLGLLRSLLRRADRVLVGGGIANTFLAASGAGVGGSLLEKGMVGDAREMLDAHPGKVLLQTDCVCAPSPDGPARVCGIGELGDSETILDIGPESARSFAGEIGRAAAVLWNGPVGLFEREAFADGTRTVAQAICASTAYSVAGGGNTVDAIRRLGLWGGFSHVSTGGGAMLEYLECGTLPGIAALGT